MQLFLPLTLIVSTLTVLNLERAVFDIMGGVRETTAADAAYEVLVVLTMLSVVLFPILLLSYVVLAILRRRRQWADHVRPGEPAGGVRDEWSTTRRHRRKDRASSEPPSADEIGSAPSRPAPRRGAGG